MCKSVREDADSALTVGNSGCSRADSDTQFQQRTSYDILLLTKVGEGATVSYFHLWKVSAALSHVTTSIRYNLKPNPPPRLPTSGVAPRWTAQLQSTSLVTGSVITWCPLELLGRPESSPPHTSFYESVHQHPHILIPCS